VPPVRRPLFLLLIAGGVAIGLVLFASGAEASPAAPNPVQLSQPDGSRFTAQLYGDEYVNGYETAAGYTIVRRNGVWTFADQDASGRLVPTGVRPGPSGQPPASLDLEPHLRDEVALDNAESEQAEVAGSEVPPPATGTQDVLVVLTQFTDQSLTTTVPDWTDLFFGADQSVRDYYDDASFGQLDLQPATETDTTGGGAANDGVVTVTLPRTHPNSGANFSVFNTVAQQALAAANASVDFDAYDSDNDGQLEPEELHLGIVVAGGEASQACAGRTIWAHRSSLDAPITADGVEIGDFEARGGYFTAGELQCEAPFGTYQSTIGIWVHEFGHDLGLIDLYDTDDSSGGVDSWSVMGIHWLALDGEPIGTRPPLPDPFSRWELGWITPDHLTTPTPDHPLGSTATTGDVAQVLDNPDGVDVGFLGGSGVGEYFLLENRQPEGYDVAVRGCGVLVWHIDESRSQNSDDDARRVDVEEAGGRNSQGGFADADDPYPSENPANAVFDQASRPDSGLNSGVPTGVSLTDFSPTCGAVQTVDVDPGGGPVARPSNDRLSAARHIPMPFASGTVRRQVRGHNVGATAQPGEPVHARARGRSTVWWAFRPPRAGYLNITSESTFREAIAVYTGPNVTHLTRVEDVRGQPPGQGGAGSPPAPENVYRGLGFRVERNVRYLIAVDSMTAGDTGGVRLFLDYDTARPDVRPVGAVVRPGQRPMLRFEIRNTSPFDPLRVYGLVEGSTHLHAIDCPASFTVAAGATRTCRFRDPITGPAGRQLRGKVTAWIEWPLQGRYSFVADSWFVRVAR
jgi:M6 family metalloprotease-like protein